VWGEIGAGARLSGDLNLRPREKVGGELISVLLEMDVQKEQQAALKKKRRRPGVVKREGRGEGFEVSLLVKKKKGSSKAGIRRQEGEAEPREKGKG